MNNDAPITRQHLLAVSGGMFFIIAQLGFDINIREDSLAFFDWVLSQVAAAALNLLGFVFRVGTERILLFDGPLGIGGLVTVYYSLTALFFLLLGANGFLFFGTSMFFPGEEKTEVSRFMRRAMVATIGVVIAPFALHMAVEFVHFIAGELYPNSLSIQLTVMDLLDPDQATEQGMTIALSTSAGVVFVILTSPLIIVTYALFLAMLGMRMVIVYSVFAVMPVLLGMWVVDIGPAKYEKMLVGFVVKAMAMLLLMGIILSGILAVGGAMAGGGAQVGDLDSQPQIEEIGPDDFIEEPTSTPTEGGIYAEGETHAEQLSGDGGGMYLAMMRVFSLMAAMWLNIAIVGGTLGAAISTGVVQYTKQFGGVLGGGKKLPVNPSDLISGSGSGDSSASPGLSDSTNASGPDADSGNDWVPDQLDTVRDTYQQAKEMKDEAFDQVEERGESIADEIRTGEDSTTGSAFNDTAREALATGVEAAGKAPKGIEKAAGYGMRAGKAYGKIWNQRGAVNSIEEMGDIMRKSDILDPNANESEDQPSPDEDVWDMFDTEGEESFWDDSDEDTDGDGDGEGEQDDEDNGEQNKNKNKDSDKDSNKDTTKQKNKDTDTDTDSSDGWDTQNDREQDSDDTETESTQSGWDTQTNTDSTQDADPTDTATDADDASGWDTGETTADESDTTDVESKQSSQAEAPTEGTPENPVDALYTNDDPSDRGDEPEVIEENAEKVAQDIHETSEEMGVQLSESEVRSSISDRVEQDLGGSIDSMGAEHAVMNKYKEASGRDGLRSAAEDYKFVDSDK